VLVLVLVPVLVWTRIPGNGLVDTSPDRERFAAEKNKAPRSPLSSPSFPPFPPFFFPPRIAFGPFPVKKERKKREK
jgi:hypothetical protein